jgi:hypothetical protein
MRLLPLTLLLLVATPTRGFAKPAQVKAVSVDEKPATVEEPVAEDNLPELKQIPKAARLGAGIGDSRMLGLGLVLGQPTGGSLKYFVSPELAVQGLVAWWLFPHDGVVVGADAVYYLRDLAPQIEPLELGAYLGAGGGAGFSKARIYHEHLKPWPHWHTHTVTQLIIYMRPVVGVSMFLRDRPFEAFVELSPTYTFSPDRGFGSSGALGGRYYF